MGRLFRRVLVLFIGLTTIAAVAAAVAAAAARQRMISSGEPDSDEVTLVGIFEPIMFRSSASHFRGGSLTCWYGGGVLDLRDATLDPGGARLAVRAVFGGGQILVPETWRVTTHVMGVFGGVGDGRPRYTRPDDAPHLEIEGIALFGGFGISSQTAGLPDAAPAAD